MEQSFAARARDWLDRVEDIRVNCQPFLQATELPLYRGLAGFIKRPLTRAKVSQVDKNRTPRDTHPEVQQLIDDWFEQRFDLRPRSQGLFCSGNIKVAKYYGPPFYVFPVGKFDFVWGLTKQGHNPLTDSVYLSELIKNKLKVTPFHTPKLKAEITDELMNTVNWYDSNLVEAQQEGGEIIIVCDEVILLPVSNAPDYPELLKRIYA